MRRLALAFVVAALVYAAPAPGRAADHAPTNDEPRSAQPGQEAVIDILAEPTLRFADAVGSPIAGLRAMPGETVTFRIINTSGFDQDFYIGTDEQLREFDARTDVGIATWQSGARELRWTVPDDVSALRFGSTVPGHYDAGMQGGFSAVTPVLGGPDFRFIYDDPLPEPEPTRYEMAEHRFALDVPWDWRPSEPGSVEVTLMPLAMLDAPPSLVESLQLPGGEALVAHRELTGGMVGTTYYITDGATVVVFEAAESDPPDDRWLSIVETIEFLPRG